MKKRTLTAMIIMMLPFAVIAENEWTVSFQTGFPLHQTSFGVQIGRLAPYGGLGLVRASGNFESSSETWERDWSTNRLYKYRDYSSKYEGSATFLMPFVGLRYYVKQKDVLAYIKGDAMLAIPWVSGESSGSRTYYNPDGTLQDLDSWSDEISKKDKESFKDMLNFMIVSPGLGIEYPLSEHFSIGGEFGFRVVLYGYDQSDTDEEDDYWKREWSDKIDVMLGISYTSFSLNYRF